MLCLSLDRGSQSHPAGIGEVLTHELIEQASHHIAGITREETVRFKGLPHSFEQHGKEQGFKILRHVRGMLLILPKTSIRCAEREEAS
nr:hypothetical protein [Zavarzinella formosa]